MPRPGACILLSLVAGLAAAPPVAADVAGPTFSLRTLGAGGAAILDTLDGFSSGYNPATRYQATLGTNWLSGSIFGVDTSGSGNEIARFDPTREYEKGTTFKDAGIGTTRTYNIAAYTYFGRVAGNTDAKAGGARLMGTTFDPYMTTNGYAGVQIAAASGGAPTWEELIPQTAAEALGAMNEGTYSSVQDKAARVTLVTLQDSLSGVNGSYGAGHWQGLEMDAFRGQLTTTDGAVGPRLVSRYFFGQGQNNFKPILVVDANAARTAEPTDTAEGTRSAYLRGRSGPSATLVSTAQFDDLVPGIADLGMDLAQDPRTGYLYILSAVDVTSPAQHDAYLSAIAPVIPDDSTQAMSWQLVDLDPNSANTYLDLASVNADLAYAGGITFSADGSRLYVSNTGTAGGGLQAVYALDVTQAPEPATLALLALGGLGLAGGLARRRAV